MGSSIALPAEFVPALADFSRRVEGCARYSAIMIDGAFIILQAARQGQG
jgi:hypothetical protein